MKKLLLAFCLLLTPAALFAQGTLYQNTVQTQQGLQAGATITVCSTAAIATAPTGATESGTTVTITSSAPHGLVVGQSVQITGVANNLYNGTFTILTVPLTTTFTVQNLNSGLGTSGGGLVLPNNVPCTPTTTIYSDIGLVAAKTNPLTSDGLGNFSFFASTGVYAYTITGAGILASSGGPFLIQLPIVSSSNLNLTGALTVSGAATFTGPNPGLVSCRLASIRYVESTNACGWTGSDAVAWIQSAANDLPATGGMVYINLPSPITTTNSVTVGSQTSEVTLAFYRAQITFNGATGNGITINCRGCGIQGAGPLLTNFLAGPAFTGDVIHYEPAVGQSDIDAVYMRDVRLDGTGVSGGTYKLMNLLSVRNIAVFDHLELRNSSGTMINVGITGNAGPSISEGVTFSNVFIQQITPKTADAVILQANRVEMGPNFNINDGGIEGTKRAIVIVTSTNGEGRSISIGQSSSCSGYDKCIVAPSTNPAPVINLVVGPGMWFENFNEAIDLTGNSLANGVNHARISGNNYTQGTGSGTPWIRLDFAQLSTIDENMSGGASTIQLTANSNGNDIRLRSSSATLADVTDAGVGNTLWVSTNSGGVAQTVVAGQFRIFRNNTLGDQWDFLDSNQLAGSSTSGISVGNKSYTFNSPAAGDFGTMLLPGGNLWLGTAATNNFKFQPASTTGARIITVADPLSPTTVALPMTIGSGTASMTTAGISTAACGTTVTVAATGVLTTDVIDWARNAAATIGNGGGLTLNAWPTAGNVNFNYCNSSAGTITPTAMTVNWSVRRP